MSASLDGPWRVSVRTEDHSSEAATVLVTVAHLWHERRPIFKLRGAHATQTLNELATALNRQNTSPQNLFS